MRFSLWRTFILVLVFALAGCSHSYTPEKHAAPEERAAAMAYLDMLRQKNYEPIKKVSDPALAGPSLHDILVQMSALFPAGEPTAVSLVGVQRINKTGESEIVNLTFEFGFSGKWLLSNVALQDQPGGRKIVGMNVVPQETSVAEQRKFTLNGKGTFQYLILALAVAVPLFTLYALIVCIKTRFKGRKWPWVVFVLCGLGKFAINWTTAEWTFIPLAIQLFGAGVMTPLDGHWYLAVSAPVGAIIFLTMRRKLAAPTAAA